MTTLKPSELQTKLTKEQKKAVGLLSIGTFLEYFDLMLYVHMAVLLNELFFPKVDPYTEQLQTALAFCSSYLLRPFGAIIFGYIGDNFGRKETVVITTFLMSASCFCMSILPTYAEVGIAAAYAVTACRMIQGVSSMGEIVGAEIYLTEMISPPKNYPYVMLMALFSVLGGTAALGVASLTTHVPNFNWRYAFGFGAIVATIGYFARMSLREAPAFANAKLCIKEKIESLNEQISANKDNHNVLNFLVSKEEKVPVKTSISLFLMQCGWPACFYFVYVYCGQVMKHRFGYSAEDVILNNFFVSMFNLGCYLILTFLCSFVHPMRILKWKVYVYIFISLLIPFVLSHANNAKHVFIMQCVCMMFVLSTNPAVPVLYSHIPILKRFTYGSLIFAISRSLMHVITGFGIVIIIKALDEYGIYVIMLPICFGYLYGVRYFTQLEIKEGRYY